jgi:hypothetical protein
VIGMCVCGIVPGLLSDRATRLGLSSLSMDSNASAVLS